MQQETAAELLQLVSSVLGATAGRQPGGAGIRGIDEKVWMRFDGQEGASILEEEGARRFGGDRGVRRDLGEGSARRFGDELGRQLVALEASWVRREGRLVRGNPTRARADGEGEEEGANGGLPADGWMESPSRSAGLMGQLLQTKSAQT